MIKKEKPEANIIFVDKEQLAFPDIRNYMDLYQYVLKMAEDKESIKSSLTFL